MSHVPPGNIEMWPLGRAIHYVRNPRKNDAVVDKMMASIREFGFKVPILARSDGTVIDGHLRLKAAARLQLAEIPVIVCDEWTDSQVKAFRLLANRSANWAEWDDDLLAIELADLQQADFDLSLTGFDDKELQKLMDDAGPAAPEAVGEMGDLEYRIIIECTDEQQQATLLDRFAADGLRCKALIS